MKHILLAICLLSVSNQSNAAQSDVQEGQIASKSIGGVNLTIALNTNAISSGSILEINAAITNSSTNTITTGETAPWRDFTVSLTSNSGKVYVLTDNSEPIIEHRNFIVKISSMKSQAWLIRLLVKKEIHSGYYTLKATRKIKADGEVFILESNSVKLKVVQHD